MCMFSRPTFYPGMQIFNQNNAVMSC